MALIDKYRPRTLKALVGHARQKRLVCEVVRRNSWDRGAFLITGPTGCGKTVLADLIAREICGCDRVDITSINGGACTVEAIRDMQASMMHSTLFGSGWKAYIIHEAQTIWVKSIVEFLSVLDSLPARRVVIFTTSRGGGRFSETQESLFTGEAASEFHQPFVDRCIRIDLLADWRTLRAMAKQAKAIAQAEQLDGLPLATYERAAKAVKGSMRALLQAVEVGRVGELAARL